MDPARQVQFSFERGLQFVIAPGLALDVADGPTEPDPQFAQGPVGALELMGITLMLDLRIFADPSIKLAEHHSPRLGQSDQPLAGAMEELGVRREHHVLGLHCRVEGELGKIARLASAGAGRDAETLLDQGSQLLFAHPLAPARER